MSDVRFAVKRLIDEGFIVLPVKPREKATRLPRWTEEDLVRPTVEDFQENSNVAIRLDNIVDVDPDCPETRAVAPNLLLITGRKHARPSSGVTHYWFDAPGIKPEQFKDTDGSMLIEIRTGRKMYTLVPPSEVYVDEAQQALEELYWDREVTAAPVDPKGLRRTVVFVATAALIIRHWPKGTRHNLIVALAGFLSRYTVDAREAIALLEEITRVAEGEVWQDCRAAVHDSFDKKETTKTTGAPTIEAILGKDVVSLLLKWYGSNSKSKEIVGSGLPQPLTEAGDAECFAAMFSETVRFDHRHERWLVCDADSGIWLPDQVDRITQMIVEMMRAQQKAALLLEDNAQKRAASRWYLDGENRKRINNCMALAKSVSPIADDGEHWDEEPFLLGTQSGVIDLRTSECRKAEPEERVTKRVRVSFDPSASCPLWLSTLQDIFQSEEVIAFMQRALGYSITGDCREECCFFIWGGGCNGKGTVMNTLGWLLGDYTDDMPYSTLERNERGTGIPNDLAKLDAKRYITCAEVNEFNMNEARLKALTGRDPITARFLNQEFFTFTPVCKVWIATNNKPKITGQDDGIWRRIHLVPFTQEFIGRENKRLKDLLRSELQGVLNWVVAGSKLWLEKGLEPPAAVKAATAAYRQESNPVAPFIEDACVQGDGLRVQASLAYKAYEKFCHEHNVDPWTRLSDKGFGKAMRQAFKVQDNGRQVHYLGVGLRAPGEQGQEPEPRNVPF